MKTLSHFFKALSDETRLRILHLLIQSGEICVCDLEAVLMLSQPKISRHLAYLRLSGLVSARKKGQWVYYRISPDLPESQTSFLNQIQSFSAADPVLKGDSAALQGVCCTDTCNPT